MAPTVLKAKVTDDIEFAYHDSGPPLNKMEYDTMVIIHGLTYHNGTFAPMLEQASALGHRIILPNRRLYPGSTPYTKEEADAFEPTHSTEDIAKAYLNQGEYLLLFVNNIIEEHKLNNIILVGWSLGSGFLSAIAASITGANEKVQENIRRAVKSLVWWDPPATVHGITDPPTGGWTPLYDESLTEEERGQAFAQWVAQYYPHKHLEKKDCHTLVYKIATPVKPPTFTGVPLEEVFTKVDLTAGLNGDYQILAKHFQPVAGTVRDLSLFNSKIRTAWGNIPFSILYGEETMYNIIWAVWKLEEESEKTGLPLKIKSMPGANHFTMQDHPKLVFDTLHACC